MSAEAVFTDADGRFVATELARGPWDPAAQHGGAAAALLMRELERLPAAEGLRIARVTYDLLRPAPIGEVAVHAEVARRGRRVQLLEGSLTTPDGTEIVRARALQVRVADPTAPRTEPAPLPPGPEEGRDRSFVEGGGSFNPPYRPLFTPDAIEVRFVRGGFGGGPSTGWFRMRVPIVSGEHPSPLQRLAAVADFGNGISAVLPWEQFVFINPDLTLYVERPPAGEWICLEARTFVSEDGVALAESVLYDERGRVGRAVQSLLVEAR